MSLTLLFRRRAVAAPEQPYLTFEDIAIQLALGGSYHDAVVVNAPLGFWLLGEHQLTTSAADRSGHAFDGTYHGDLTFGHRGPFPHGGTVIEFDGSSGYVDVGDVDDFELTAALTIELLVKFTTDDVGYLVSKGFGDVPNGWTVSVQDGQIFFFHTQLDGTVVFSTITPAAYNDGEWHHIVCTWDGLSYAPGSGGFPLLLGRRTAAHGFARIYVDSVLVSDSLVENGSPGVGAPAAARLIIGAKDVSGSPGSVGGFFEGSIAGVAVYDDDLSAATIAAHYATLQWTDITDDVLSSPRTVLEYGTHGNKPLDRLADSGTLEFTLDNSTNNSAGLAGYYSRPSHPNARPGFTDNIPVRVLLTFADVVYQRFWGRIAMIDPEPGVDRLRATHVMAHDYQFILADTDVREITPQLDKSEVDLIRTIFDALPLDAQPMALDLAAPVDVYTYAFYDLQGGRRAATALQHVIVSAWGRGFTKGDGTFTYTNRQATVEGAIEFNFDDTQLLQLEAPTDRSNVFDQVRVITHPKQDPDATPVVLYSHSTAPFVLPNGETLEFFADYRNPNNSLQMIGGKNFEVPLVSGTDFIANSAADGSGSNLTASVTVDAYCFASTVKFRLTNNHATLGAYFTTLQVRGEGIYDIGPTTSPAGAARGQRPLTVDLRYQDDENTGRDLAEFILNERNTIANQVDFVTVDPHASPTAMLFAAECEPGELVSITEGQTGLDEAQAMVRLIRLEFGEAGIFEASVGLVPILVGDAWELDVDALDVSTVLGYA